MKLLLAFLFLASLCHTETLGIINHNPGNISADSLSQLKYWHGAIGIDAWHHIQFDNDQDGAEAIFKNLRIYRSRHKIHTIRQAITRWVWQGVNLRERGVHKLRFPAFKSISGFPTRPFRPWDTDFNGTSDRPLRMRKRVSFRSVVETLTIVLMGLLLFFFSFFIVFGLADILKNFFRG